MIMTEFWTRPPIKRRKEGREGRNGQKGRRNRNQSKAREKRTKERHVVAPLLQAPVPKRNTMKLGALRVLVVRGNKQVLVIKRFLLRAPDREALAVSLHLEPGSFCHTLRPAVAVKGGEGGRSKGGREGRLSQLKT